MDSRDLFSTLCLAMPLISISRHFLQLRNNVNFEPEDFDRIVNLGYRVTRFEGSASYLDVVFIIEIFVSMPPPIINFNAALRASTAWLWYLDHFYFYSMLIVCAILNFPWGWKSVCAGHTVKELCMIGQCQVSRSKISSSPRDGNIRIAWLKCPNDMPDLASTKYSSSLNYMINYIFAKLFLTLTADEEIQNFG